MVYSGAPVKARVTKQYDIAQHMALLIACAAAMLCFAAPLIADAETKEERRARLERELAAIEADIEAKRGDLSILQAERTTLERDVAILDAQIDKAQLEIRQRNIALQQIGGDITEKQNTIEELDAKIARGHESLAQLIRLTREIDNTSLIELALAGSLSDFFADVDNFETLQREMGVSFEEIRALQEDLGARTRALEEQYEEEESLRQLQVLERDAIRAREEEKQEILDATRGEEEAYQDLIAERERSAAQIRAALFSLRDSADISFGAAYEYAKAAEAVTGVRAAFVLGILKNESDLGRNVGQCLLTNSPNKGDGIGKNTGRSFPGVMKPTRDVDPFMQITAELGIDPSSQVVSCPQSVGYGGAMGPAQFIPSTWMMYKDRIARAVGQNPPNPWDPRTAFFASSLFLSDLGADRGTRAAEREAALRYFAGGGWQNPAFASYGDRVLGFAAEFQAQIDILEGN